MSASSSYEVTELPQASCLSQQTALDRLASLDCNMANVWLYSELTAESRNGA